MAPTTLFSGLCSGATLLSPAAAAAAGPATSSSSPCRLQSVSNLCALQLVHHSYGEIAPWTATTTRRRRRMQSWSGHRVVMAAAASGGAVTVDTDAPPSVLVQKLLSLVEGTDRGTGIGEREKGEVEEIVAKLETLCIPEPLASPLLFGDWEVAYSSNPTAPGGYYRSMLGRAVLKTRDMVQSITAPDAITNRVAFAALGLLDGQVTLQGKLTALDKKWVEVVFEAPEVVVGGLKLQYGGNSSVKLAVLYLDDVVRIGRGSRGSLFIFKRRT